MRVKVFVQEGGGNAGERVPMLLSKKNNLPLFYPNVYVTTMLRTTNAQSATLEVNLYSLKHLYAWARNNQIDLEARFLEKGEFLNEEEAESLRAAVKLRHKALVDQGIDIPDPIQKSRRVQPQVRKRRAAKKSPSLYRSSKSCTTTLSDIRGYLDWLAGKAVGRVPAAVRSVENLKKDRSEMKEWLKIGLNKANKGRNSGTQTNEGLSREDDDRLFALVHPDAPDNPFSHGYAKFRNYVFMKVCRDLALRKSEALGFYVDDIDFDEGTITVYRRPDNREDKRTNEPNAKTLDRELILGDDLCRLLKKYITEYREKYDGCKEHNFIFVAEGTGKALSKSSANQIFETIRNITNLKLSDALRKVTAHILRFTWCDRYYDENVEVLGKSDLISDMIYQCGWAKNTKMVEKYANRAIDSRARRRVYDYQERVFARKGGNDAQQN